MTPIERNIATKLIGALLEAGYRLGVSDGEEIVLRYSNDPEAILSAMASTSEDYLLVYAVTKQGDGLSYAYNGWIKLIWGNGIDLISDHNMHLSEYIDPILDWLTSVEDIAEHNRPAVPTTDADAPMGA